MRIRFCEPITLESGQLTTIGDLVIDPMSMTVTHVTLHPHRQPERARLVAVDKIWRSGGISRCEYRRDELEYLPHAPAADGWLAEIDRLAVPGREVGISELAASPRFGLGLGPRRPDLGVTLVRCWDEVDERGIALRRLTQIWPYSGKRLGTLAGAVISEQNSIAHLLVAKHHPTQGLEVSVPAGVVESFENDRVNLTLTRAQFRALPTYRSPKYSGTQLRRSFDRRVVEHHAKRSAE